MPPPSSNTRPKNPTRRLVLASLGVISLVVALAVAEVVLRAFDLPRAEMAFFGGENASSYFTTDPELYWRLDADEDRIFVNEHGLRGPWPQRAHRRNDLRIVCIGDSSTFGLGVRLDQTYGHRLERKLHDLLPGRNVSTTLFALPGYSTYQNRVLVERHAEHLRPDVSVFYCGAWNDFVPALGLRDSARRGSQSSLRILSLVRNVFGAGDGSSDKDYVEEFRQGRAPDGRRVELAEFRDNLLDMINRLRQIGSRIIVILPPVPTKTLREFPISAEYRRVVKAIGRTDGILFLDGQALFEAFLENVPEGWRKDEFGKSILFRDWIHPAALGHELLGDALLESLQKELSRWRATSRTSAMRLGTPEPRSIAYDGRTEVSLALPEGATVERVWLGERVVRRFKSNPKQLILTVPEHLPPGAHRIRIATAEGIVSSDRPVLVQPPPIRASVRRTDQGDEVVADLEGPRNATVILWVARGARTELLHTRYGDFALQFEGNGRPDGRTDLPLHFGKLPLPTSFAAIDETGKASIRQKLVRLDGIESETVYVQALVFAADDEQPFGYLTNFLTIRVAR